MAPDSWGPLQSRYTDLVHGLDSAATGYRSCTAGTSCLSPQSYDVRYRRIPNWLTAIGVLLGLGLNTFLYQGWPGLRFSLMGLGLAFGIYFGLYAVRAMGAGDVKLMAAIGALVGW